MTQPLSLLKWPTPRTSHYVCFDCRKQFRKPVAVLGRRLASGKTERAQGYFDVPLDYCCPQCARPLTHMGKNFRAPPQHDKEAWEVARRLAQAGFKHSYTTHWPYPTRLKDVPAFLQRHKGKSEGEYLLEQWSKNT